MFSLSLFRRRFRGFGGEAAGMFLICSHPTVWNPKSKDFWEKSVNSGSVYIYICEMHMSISMYRNNFIFFFFFFFVLASFSRIWRRGGRYVSHLLAPDCLEP